MSINKQVSKARIFRAYMGKFHDLKKLQGTQEMFPTNPPVSLLGPEVK